MNIYDIMNANQNALVADATLQGYGNTWFDADINVFIDPPVDNPIGEDSAPYIHIHSWNKQASTNQPVAVCGHLIDVVIYDDQDVTEAEDNAFETRGTGRLTTIVRRVNAVLLANRPENSDFSFQWETDTEGLFPSLVAYGQIEYTKRLTLPVNLYDFY